MSKPRVGLPVHTSPYDIADLVRKESGESFKADWHGAWDEFFSDGIASVVWVNAGDGPVESVAVINRRYGIMYYVGPFSLEQLPSKEQLLMFRCTGAFFVSQNEPRGKS